ncbi:MAG TPA: LEPR-XLL domain-containing protein, partial [Phycisphaerae bacterium]|nr:LEPR-XLL domain-containing protein [Phycisphaerae bacterium]
MDTGTTTHCLYWPSFETLEPRLLLSTTVDLTISDISGVNRIDEPVTSGVPLPDGGITSTGNIRLMDGAQEVPAQFKILSRWNAEVDQTGAYIKWVLVDFQADVNANSSKVYTLEYGSEIGHGSFGPNLLTDNGTYHTVDTGPLAFDVDHSAFELFNGVTVNGQTIVADSAGNQVIVIEDETGATYTSTLGAPSDIVVEENGPLKAVIQVRGPLVNDGSVSYWDRDSQAEYAVTYAGGTTTVTIDQDTGSGQWVSVGTYTFNAGSGGYVRLTHDSEDANPTIADGVRFVKVVGGTEYLLDNHEDAARGRHFSVTGEWDESAAIDEFNIDYFDSFVYPSNGSSLFTKEVDATATWTPELAEAGDYEVFVWYSAEADPSDLLGPEAPPENTRIIQSMPYVEYNARITVYKDKDYARVLFIMENNGTAGFFPESKYTDDQSVFIEDLRLNTQMIDFGTGATVYTPTGSYALNNQTVIIGTDGEYGQRFDFGPDTFDYEMTIGSSTADSGTKYDGWMEISNTAGDRNVAVGVKYFWQKHPGALAFSDSDMLSVAVLPAGGGYPQLIEPPQYESTNYDLDGGRHVSWEMMYRFSTGARNGAATDAAMLMMNDPLFAFAPSAWYETTGAWGNLARESVQVNDAELQAVIDTYEQLADAMVDPAAIDNGSQAWVGGLTLDQLRGDAKKWFGYMNFGDQIWAEGYSSNHYDWSQAMFLHAIRHGDPQFYQMAQQLLPHERDVDQYWGQAADTGGEHLWSNFLSRYEKDNHNNDDNNPTPKQSHNWNGGLVLSYLLTGDMEALRAAEEHGKFAANRWSAALTTQFEAGTEIRNEGWTITGLLNLWRATGKQEYLDLALGIGKNVVLYTEWNLCGGNGVTAGPMVDPAPGFTGRTDRMENTSWMYLNESITDLYEATGDADIGGLLVRMADFHMEHNFYGGDYDQYGNYRPLLTDYFYVGDEVRDGPDGGGSSVIRPFFVNTIAEAYRITGEAKYLLFARKFFRDTIYYYTGGNWYIDPDVYRAPLSYNDFRFPGTSTKVKGWMLRTYQNYLEIEGSLGDDVTAPSNITDLAAGSPTDTTVLLTWTAPGNDGST